MKLIVFCEFVRCFQSGKWQCCLIRRDSIALHHDKDKELCSLNLSNDCQILVERSHKSWVLSEEEMLFLSLELAHPNPLSLCSLSLWTHWQLRWMIFVLLFFSRFFLRPRQFPFAYNKFKHRHDAITAISLCRTFLNGFRVNRHAKNSVKPIRFGSNLENAVFILFRPRMRFHWIKHKRWFEWTRADTIILLFACAMSTNPMTAFQFVVCRCHWSENEWNFAY